MCKSEKDLLLKSLSHAKAWDRTDVNRAEHDTRTHTDEALWDMISLSERKLQ